MDRRILLKTMALSAGYVVTTPTLMQLLASCEAKHRVSWKPLFLNEAQAYAVEKIANVILPQTLLPAASTVNTPQFVDLVLNDVISEKKRNVFVKGAEVFTEKFKNLFDKSLLSGTNEDFENIVALYFNLEEDDAEHVVELTKSDEEDVKTSDTYYLYNYLLFVRYYTLFAYTSSEALQDEFLKYNPYTSTFTPCVLASEFESE